jgi:NTP pyrophosphatase (non-canonical NTP hydrolase)
MSSYPLHDPSKPATGWALSPWVPMSRAIDLKHLGKLGEELGEASAAVSRCIIQGIGECEPVTKKPNKEWLENELADVQANIALVTKQFGLDAERMAQRVAQKIEHLSAWHRMLDEERK